MVEYPAVRLSRTFGALADPTRRDILARLRTGSLRVTEIAAPFDMSLNALPAGRPGAIGLSTGPSRTASRR